VVESVSRLVLGLCASAAIIHTVINVQRAVITSGEVLSLGAVLHLHMGSTGKLLCVATLSASHSACESCIRPARSPLVSQSIRALKLSREHIADAITASTIGANALIALAFMHLP
jgi:hypothetical protein